MSASPTLSPVAPIDRPPQERDTGAARAIDHAPDARRQLFVADLLAMFAGLLLVQALHRPMGVGAPLAAGGVAAHAALLASFTMVTLYKLGMYGQYEAGVRFSPIDDVPLTVRAAFIGAAIAVFIAVLTKGFFFEFEAYSRSYVAIGFVVPTLLLIVSRLTGHARQVRAFAAGRYLARTLIVGSDERAYGFLTWLQDHPGLGLQGQRSAAPLDASVCEYMTAFCDELDQFEPDEVVMAHSPDDALRAAIIREASFRGVAVKVLPDLFENYLDLPQPRYNGIPVTTIFDSPGDRFARRIKYIIDRVGALGGLVLLSPVFAAIALAIWVEDRGPVIYAQERVGERGKRFRVRKFRTMHIDAESRRSELDALNEAQGPIFKMRNDPRITRVGRWLRRTSFDEFPQLWNVAFGEMSLVGPRPPIPDEVDQYPLQHRRRLMTRPGMTGLWQVSGRSETTFDEMVRLDLAYIEHWSLWLDLRILLRTVAVVVLRRGAY
jgi:exopolysaccharide biosynthesis polyprenyl glycosylphosphotransferase